MTVQQLTLAVTVGAGAIAVWLDVRLGPRSPRTLRTALTNLGVSLCGLNLIPLLLTALVDDSSPASKIVGVLVIVLPLLTYVFLSSIWLIKQFHSALRLR